MHIEAGNPVIKNGIQDAMIQKNYIVNQSCFDTDNVAYKIFGIENLKQFRFCYRGNDSKKILAAGGMDMLKEIYADYLLPESEWDHDFDVTLKIDCKGLPKTQKVSKKTMDEDTQEKVR